MILDTNFILKALKPRIVKESLNKNLDRVFDAVLTDSRRWQAQGDCVFVALKGERVDGHEFIPAMLNLGGKGCFILSKSELVADIQRHGFDYIVVDDCLGAFRDLAAAWRRLFQGPVIAVAGAVGKTSTKNMMSAILRESLGKVCATNASENGFIGIAISLLNIRPEHKAAVIEIGIDEPGAMEQHARVVSPDIAVMTKIGPEHLEKLGSLDVAAREELKLFDYALQMKRTIILNGADDFQLRWYQTIQKSQGSERVTVHILRSRESDRVLEKNTFDNIVIGSYSQEKKNLSIVESLNSDPFEVSMEQIPGRHQASNLLAVYAALKKMGVVNEVFRQAAQNLKSSDRRGNIAILAQSKTAMIADYYNASPEAMNAGFEMVSGLRLSKEYQHYNKLILLLGDMRELGTMEEYYHRELAPKILGLNPREIFLYGKAMTFLWDELQKKSPSNSGPKIVHSMDKNILLQAIQDTLGPQTLLYVKGSRGMMLDDIVDKLT